MKIVIALLMAIGLSGCGMEMVDTGNRGVKTTFGKIVGEPLTEGLYFYNPLTSKITEFSVKQEQWSARTEIFTKDTQKVVVDFTVVYYADPDKVSILYRDVGNLQQLTDKIIKPVVLGSMKDAIGSIIADELVMKREIVTKQALKEITENLATKFVKTTDLQFTNINFDDEYEKAVEQKVVAIQNAQKAKNTTVQIEEEAKQTVKTAQAEAESMRIKSQALAQNKGLVQFELAKKWDGKLPQTMFGNSIPMIDMKTLSGKE